MARSRVRAYLVVRLLAVIAFLVGAVALPRGVPAGLLVVGAGVVAVGSSLWSNAGAPGERAGAREQDRWFDSVMPPQGDWPPYEPGPDLPSGPPAAAPRNDDPRT
jgi:hypothetical protein